MISLLRTTCFSILASIRIKCFVLFECVGMFVVIAQICFFLFCCWDKVSKKRFSFQLELHAIVTIVTNNIIEHPCHSLETNFFSHHRIKFVFLLLLCVLISASMSELKFGPSVSIITKVSFCLFVLFTLSRLIIFNRFAFIL